MKRKNVVGMLKRALVTTLAVAMFATGIPAVPAMAEELTDVPSYELTEENTDVPDEAVGEETGDDSESQQGDVEDDEETSEEVVVGDDETSEEAVEAEEVISEEITEVESEEEESPLTVNIKYKEGAEPKVASGNNPGWVYPLWENSCLSHFGGYIFDEIKHGSSGPDRYSIKTATIKTWYVDEVEVRINIPGYQVTEAVIAKKGEEPSNAEITYMGNEAVIKLGDRAEGVYNVEITKVEKAAVYTYVIEEGNVDFPGELALDIRSYDNAFAAPASYTVNDEGKKVYTLITKNESDDFVIRLPGVSYEEEQYFRLYDSNDTTVLPERYPYRLKAGEKYKFDMVLPKGDARITLAYTSATSVFAAEVVDAERDYDSGQYIIENKSCAVIRYKTDGAHFHKVKVYADRDDSDSAVLFDPEIVDIKYGTDASTTEVTWESKIQIKYLKTDGTETFVRIEDETGYSWSSLNIFNIPTDTKISIKNSRGEEIPEESYRIYSDEEYMTLDFSISPGTIGDKYTVTLTNENVDIAGLVEFNPRTNKETQIDGNVYEWTTDVWYRSVDVQVKNAAKLVIGDSVYNEGDEITVFAGNKLEASLLMGKEPFEAEYSINYLSTVLKKGKAEGGKIEYTVPSTYAGKTIVIKLKVDGALKDYFYVKPVAKLTTVKLGGRTAVEQSLGKAMTYAVTFDTGVNAANVELGSVTDGINAVYDAVTKKLTVSQIIGKAGYVAEGKVEFVDTVTNATAAVTVKFNDNAFKAMKPVAKVVYTTDRAVKLDLTSPVTGEYDSRLGYCIKAENLASDEEVTKIVAVSADSKNQTYEMQLIDCEEGKGAAENYKITVGLVLVEDDTIIDAAGTAVLAKVSTKNPAYATKLTLKPITTRIYSSKCGLVPLARATYDKESTYNSMDIDSFEFVKSPFPCGGVVEPVIIDDTLYIRIDDFSGYNIGLMPGSYTVQISAATVEGMVGSSAQVKFTVVDDIVADFALLKLSTEKVTRKERGNATVKSSWDAITSMQKKTRPSKVRYEIDGSEHIRNAVANKEISVSAAGVVTITPKYQVAETKKDNTFYLRPTVEDKSGNVYHLVSTSCVITDEFDEIDHVDIVGADGKKIDISETYTTDKFFEAKVHAYDKDGNEIKDIAVTLPGGTVQDNEITDIKVGTSTLVVKTVDGGNKSARVTLKTKYYVSEKLDLTNGSGTVYGSEVEVEDCLAHFNVAVDKDSDTRFTAMTCDAPKMNLKVTATGGTLVKNDESYNLIIAKRSAVVTVKDIVARKEYKTTFINKKYVEGKVRSLTAKNRIYADDWSDSVQTIAIKPNVKLDNESSYKLVVADAGDASILDSLTAPYDYAANEFRINTNYGSQIQVGKYVLYAYIYNETSGECVAGPLKVTVNAIKNPVASVRALSLKMKASKGTVAVPVKGVNCQVVRVVSIANANVKGQPNKFASCFKIGESGMDIVVAVDEKDTENIAKEDRTGYAVLEVKDNANITRTLMVKVTVNIVR